VRRGGGGFEEIGRLDKGDQRVDLRSGLWKAREGVEIMQNEVSLAFLEEQELSYEGIGSNYHCIQPRATKEDVLLQVSREY